jgi:hypothetical protein
MFDPTRGAKAYSYFGTIVKRHLINYNNKNYKRLKSLAPVEDFNGTYELEVNYVHPDALTLRQIVDIYVERTYDKLETLFPKESDRKVADAVLTLFEKRYDLDIFKKKALYIYIREMTGTETPYLTKVINVLKEEFYNLYTALEQKGMVDLKN